MMLAQRVIHENISVTASKRFCHEVQHVWVNFVGEITVSGHKLRGWCGFHEIDQFFECDIVFDQSRRLNVNVR